MTTRRRVLTILAGVAALPVIGARAATGVQNWRGIALGAEARIILDHPDAEKLIVQAVLEIERLENIFSLYAPESELSRLNRDGVLANPSFDMIELFSLCGRLHAVTGGAFDPSVQMLWALYARSYAAGAAPRDADIFALKDVTGWQNVVFSGEQISFAKPGVNLTLNGIAQGYIADKVSALFRRAGVENVLVNTGEIAALGVSPEGTPWPITLNTAGGDVLPLSNAAIATSAPLGTVFDAGGKMGHIIDPRTGYPGGKWSEVSVVSASAAEADGLSTAFCLMDRDEIAAASGQNKVLLGHEI